MDRSLTKNEELNYLLQEAEENLIAQSGINEQFIVALQPAIHRYLDCFKFVYQVVPDKQRDECILDILYTPTID
ncbi:MAG: hypothetical protein PV340_03175 [Wolbachia sp.]|nr:hypothetical protein [Wolbachia sp.]MDD9336666.1 hypothetical protein [Wolbachia sp.]